MVGVETEKIMEDVTLTIESRKGQGQMMEQGEELPIKIWSVALEKAVKPRRGGTCPIEPLEQNQGGSSRWVKSGKHVL